MFLINIRIKKCVMKLSILTLLQYHLFLNTIRLKKCVTKLLILVFFYLSLFPIDTRLKKKYVIDVSEDPFMLIYCPNRCKTKKKKKKKSDEAVNDCLVALKFIPD